MKRWATALAILALVGAGILGAYVWHRHENKIERAVHAQLRSRGIHANWVSCSKDHTVRVGSMTVTYYQCDLHGESQPRNDGIVPSGSQVCVPFVGDRVATEAEVRHISLEDSFCENFG